jgi:G:T-mismatch repair DNA endonuclease (very short patch repair protein)
MPRKKGFKHTEETKLKISKSEKGKLVSIETRNKISLSNLGKHSSNNTEFKKGMIPWNKGKIKVSRYCIDCEKEISRYSKNERCHSCAAKGIRNHFFGKSPMENKKHTLETIEKIRKQKIEWINNNPEIINQISIKVKANAKINPNFGMKGKRQSLNCIQKSKARRALQTFPIKDTKIELKIQSFLKQLNIEFSTHNYISEIAHAYQCDIQINPQPNFISERKTILELDGDYWHANPKFYPIEELTEKQKKQIERDAYRNEELRAAGFNVIRMWENDIKKMSLEDFKEIVLTKVNLLRLN